MSPKKQVAKETKKDLETKATTAEQQKRNDQKLMVTSLSKSTDPAKKQVLDLYRACGRFDEQKNILLARWKADKSCRWVVNFTQEATEEKSSSTGSMEGFGTKLGAQRKN